MTETQVLIVGAGPVGLTLAIDLGRRGVRCTLVERNETSIQLPKMERCNVRTMEIFRRLGIAEQIRDVGLPREAVRIGRLASFVIDQRRVEIAISSLDP
jgi:2-polyprenyl-6-methoxyphenol hydroxylase-like FAD-dependent oxidoreductase